MSLTNFVPERNRVYVRKFDHDEARSRHAAGERIQALADEYGVTYQAVYFVVMPGAQAAQAAYNKEWRTTVCEVCGGPAMKLTGGKREHNPDGRILCHRCRSDERRERLRFNEQGTLVSVRCSSLDCATGTRGQTPRNFGRGRRHCEVRAGGINARCRACQTRARQEYRERIKVPCTNCGEPCLPPNEKGARGSDTGLCRPCWIASVTKDADLSPTASAE